jgi:hypothetical protein
MAMPLCTDAPCVDKAPTGNAGQCLRQGLGQGHTTTSRTCIRSRRSWAACVSASSAITVPFT